MNMSRQQRRQLERQGKAPQAQQQIDIANVRAWDLPQYRQQVAMKHGCDKHMAIVTYGGLGDVLCAEPTVRYAVEVLVPCLKLESITVVTRFPDLFRHLPVELILTSEDGKLEVENGQEKYHWVYCGHNENNLQHSFFTHNSMLPVDYPAVSALRMQLPLKYRTLWTTIEDNGWNPEPNMVYVHAGAHWESKRFPKQWWDDVLNQLCYRGIAPVLIGGPPTYDQLNPGTVDVNTAGCLDLRGKLRLSETAEHLVKAQVLVTNDSFPLHMATIGHCHIGFFGTAKDPEWLMHYRKNYDKIEFGWRMENLAKGGAYQRTFTTQPGGNHLSKATPEELAAWLPTPKEVAIWAESKLL